MRRVIMILVVVALIATVSTRAPIPAQAGEPIAALTGLLPGTCAHSSYTDPTGDAVVDVATYSLLYNCKFGSWRFDANLTTFDPFTFGTLSLSLDTDNNTSDGCSGADILIQGSYDVGTPQHHSITHMWRTPSCSSSVLVRGGAFFAPFGTDLRVLFAQSDLGDPATVRWRATVTNNPLSSFDLIPDDGSLTFTGFPTLSDSYWLADAGGHVQAVGLINWHGDLDRHPPAAPIVGMARVPGLGGYWLLGRDGGVFSFGTAAFYGSTGNLHLNQPVVGMAATPTGHGYWFVAADGGIFSFGDAKFYGSTGALHLNEPIVGMAPTPTGHGYWLVASDGGIFSFGDAKFYGSTGSLDLARPIVGMTPTPSGHGYWFVASDGGVFSFGDAKFYGSSVGLHPGHPIVGMRSSHTGLGYDMAASDGEVFKFGDARSYGGLVGLDTNTIVAIG